MLTIARAMGFPPALWFDDSPGDGTRIVPAGGQDLCARVGHLFEAVRHPGTGESYTDAEVARRSAGVLTEEEVEGISRTGASAAPRGEVVAWRPRGRYALRAWSSRWHAPLGFRRGLAMRRLGRKAATIWDARLPEW